MNHELPSAIGALLALILLPSAVGSPADAAPAGARAPDMFGTVALAVGHTPYEVKWKRVLRSGLPSRHAIAVRARALRGIERLRYVNAAVNDAVAHQDDSHNWGSADHWATARETLARGAGDCEDYAITKLQALRRAGIPAADMFLVVGRDVGAGGAHAVLVVRQAREYWVLDNVEDEVRPSREYPGFRPALSFGARGAWLHGYRVALRPPQAKRPANGS